MSHITLGSITTDKDSLFRVTAISSTGQALEYKLASGKLPPGLYIDQSGEIYGMTKDNVFELDEGITYFDTNGTTFDRRFNFNVRATNKDGILNDTHGYGINLRKISSSRISRIYGAVRPDKATRVSYQQFITDPDIFPKESLFRQGDLNFRTDDLRFLILSGVHSPDLTDLFNLMGNNFYNAKLQMGDIKVARAKDPNGETIYDVVYVELLDAYTKSPNSISFRSQNLPSIIFNYSSSSVNILSSNSNLKVTGTNQEDLYINSFKNMRGSIQDGMTVESFEYLPLWMKSPQENNITPGFKLALPINYVKPGEGQKIVYKIKNESSYDLKGVNIEIDRIYINKHDGTTIDENRTEQTFISDGSTTSYTLAQESQYAKNVLVLVGGVGYDTSQYSVSTDPSTKITTLTFNTAPANGSEIKLKRKKTTFGLHEYATFDNNTTTFDAKGTTFFVQNLTFDKKLPEDTQLIMLRSNILDQVNNLSKRRELIRTPI